MAGKKSRTSKMEKKILKKMRISEDRRKETRRLSWSVASGGMPEAGYAIRNSVSPNTILNACLQGTDTTQRVGSQIKEVGLRIKGMINQKSTSVDHVCGCVRFLCVRDHDNKSTSPSLTDVLESASTPDNVGSLVKWSNRKRFTILEDCIITLQAQASGTSAATACASVDIDLRKVNGVGNTLTYQSNDFTAGSLNDGGIYAWFIYCNAAVDPAAGELPMFNGTVNFFFKDV